MSLFLSPNTPRNEIKINLRVIFSVVTRNSVDAENEHFVQMAFAPKNNFNTAGYFPHMVIKHDDLYNDLDKYCPNGKIEFKIKILFERWIEMENDDSIMAILEDFASFYHEMKNPDLVIMTSDSKSLSAHKAVLSARSNVMERMFTTEMKEKSDGVFVINGFNSDEVKELLRFIYCGTVENIEKFDIELYKAGDIYNIKGLQSKRLKSMYERLNASNVIEIIELANVYDGLDDLYKCCISIISM